MVLRPETISQSGTFSDSQLRFLHSHCSGCNINIPKLTMLSLVYVAGMRGRWNLRWDPTAPGSGGADRLAATKLIISIQSWHSVLLLKVTNPNSVLKCPIADITEAQKIMTSYIIFLHS